MEADNKIYLYGFINNGTTISREKREAVLVDKTTFRTKTPIVGRWDIITDDMIGRVIKGPNVGLCILREDDLEKAERLFETHYTEIMHKIDDMHEELTNLKEEARLSNIHQSIAFWFQTFYAYHVVNDTLYCIARDVKPSSLFPRSGNYEWDANDVTYEWCDTMDAMPPLITEDMIGEVEYDSEYGTYVILRERNDDLAKTLFQNYYETWIAEVKFQAKSIADKYHRLNFDNPIFRNMSFTIKE